MKRIVYIHQYFNTPQQGGSLRSYYLSTALAKEGYDVQLITSHNQKFERTETIDGVKVHYLPVAYDNNFGFYTRIKSFILFTIKSLLLTRKLKPDLIFATSTPLTIGLVPLYLSYFRKTPYLFEVRDLWPKAPIEMGYIKNVLLKKLTYQLEKLIYNKSSGIVALSPGMEEHIKELLPGKRVICISNMADTKYFRPDFQELHKANSGLTICYIGSCGPVNELQNLIKFAEHLQLNKYHDIQINIAAKGKELNSLIRTCQKLNLKNIHFLPFQNQEGIRNLLAKSDFTYISFKDLSSLRIASPNKLFDSLAAGVPVISAINGWWVNDLKHYNCGLNYNPQKPAELYQALLPFIENPDLINQYKQNAYFLAHSKFSREKLTQQFSSFIKKFI